MGEFNTLSSWNLLGAALGAGAAQPGRNVMPSQVLLYLRVAEIVFFAGMRKEN